MQDIENMKNIIDQLNLIDTNTTVPSYPQNTNMSFKYI